MIDAYINQSYLACLPQFNSLNCLTMSYQAINSQSSYLMINRRQKSKPALPEQRPQTTPHPSHQNLTNTYKYLTLSPNEHRKLTPYLPSVTRILNKIGTSKKTNMFEPQKAQQKQYHTKRYSELRQEFSNKRPKSKFEFEVDEVVLDCYDHTIQQGRRSIWKKYRSKLDDLSFQVMKMKLTRRGSGIS